MRSQEKVLLLSSFSVLIFSTGVGCVASGPYYWGEYENKLYAAYKNPEQVGAFHQQLLSIIQTAPEKGKKIPPGICAEYGYALYLSGETAQAVAYFAQEAREWPESASLMTRLIETVETREAAASSDSSRGSTDASHEDEATDAAVSEGAGEGR